MRDMAGPRRKTTLAPQEHTLNHRPWSPSTRTRLQSSQLNTTMNQNSATRTHIPRPIARTPTTTHRITLPHYAQPGATRSTRSKLRQSSSTGQTATLRHPRPTTRNIRVEGKARCNRPSRTKISTYHLHRPRTGRMQPHYRISTHTARPILTSHPHHSTLHAIRNSRPSRVTIFSASHM